MVWTLIEPGVAIVASSLVTIRPLLRQMRFKGFESSEHSRSGGFWARYGRSGGDRYGNKKHSANKRSRAASGGLDAFEVKHDVKLDDLEAGYAAPTTADDSTKKPIATKSGGRGYYSSRETTLTSHSSSRDRELGKSPVRNFSAPLRIAAATGPPVPAKDDAMAATVHKEADGEDDTTTTSPVSPWMLRRESEPGLTFPKQQQPATLRGHVQNGKTMWRSETPNSAEEAEAIQGLRELSSRTGAGRSPFS